MRKPKKTPPPPPLRALRRVEGVWEKTELPTDTADLIKWCIKNDGEAVVVIDDAEGMYYCGRWEDVEAYRAKGKKADCFYPLAKNAWERAEDKQTEMVL